MGKTNLFLDLDGPILDVSEKYYRLYHDLVTAHGGEPIPKSQYWTYKRDLVADKTILRLSGLEDWTETYRLIRRERIEQAEYLAYDTVWPGVLELLRELAGRNSVLLVTLRHSREALLWQLENLELLPLFDYVLSAAGDGPSAQRPNVKVSLVQSAFGPKSFSGWFVGDTETDIRAGQILGLNTVAVTYGIRTVEQLESLKPDVLAHDPNQFLAWAKVHLTSEEETTQKK